MVTASDRAHHPTLLALFSIVAAVAHQQQSSIRLIASLVSKTLPTFADALALVRQQL